jgi:RimJ/RimL family protein N-acetyltransferase
MKIISIQTTTCTLRNLQERDAASFATLANNPNIAQNLRDYFPYPYTMQHAIDFIRMEMARPMPMNLAIEVNGEAVGAIGISPLSDVYRYGADFGYWLGQPYWGKGIMTQAAKAMVNYVFHNFPLTRLQGSVFDFNEGSMKVLHNAGFQLECIARDAVFKNGRQCNEHRFALLKNDWMKLQS